MFYTQQKQPSHKRLTGLFVVIGFHLLLGYALISGAAKKIVETIKPPLLVGLVDGIQTTQSGPQSKAPHPSKQTNVQPHSSVAQSTEVPREIPNHASAIAEKNLALESSSATSSGATKVTVSGGTGSGGTGSGGTGSGGTGSGVANVAVACPNHLSVRNQVPYPEKAQRLGVSGSVVVDFTVDTNGRIKDVSLSSSTNNVFNNTAKTAVSKLNCIGQGREVRVTLPFAFHLEA